jgi:uncharacterized protein YggT (Ycf19 family)
MGDNQRQIARSEETVVSGDPGQTTVSQTASGTTNVVNDPAAQTASSAPYLAAPAVANQGMVQTTTTSQAPSDRVVSHNVAESVIDPAAEKAAGVNWFNSLVWFIVGLLSVLLIIRFILLAAGANESAGFAQLIYGLTGWMVAPFAGLFGQSITYPGAAGTGVLEFEAFAAIVVIVLLGWLVTKIADLALGTNRTTGTVYSETERKTKL